MDQEIRSLAESSLHGHRPPEHWTNFNKSLRFIYGQEDSSRVALLVKDEVGELVYLSDNAPMELARLPVIVLPETQGEDYRGNTDHFSKKLDMNADARVSREEFDGPVHDFIRFDADQDGFISSNEFDATEAPPRRGFRSGAPDMSSIKPNFMTVDTVTGDWRIGMFRDPRTFVVIGMDMDMFYGDINRFRIIFMIAMPLGLLFLGVAGWFVASRAMKPIAAIAETTESITSKGLDKRIPQVGTDSELERLVSVSNAMLDRLEKGYHQAVRFSADAAHELQTPLTILQGELDNAIQDSADGSKEQQRYSMLLDELRNLKSVVQKLLLLSHADEGCLKLNRQNVSLSALIDDAVEDLEIMAPELNVELLVEKECNVSADPVLLNQVVRNMTSNAAKYASEKGTVIFRLKAHHGMIFLNMANTARPIPEEDRSLLFERFHRVEKSRSSSGSGLGLSLAREIARAHGGELLLDEYKDGMVSFSLTIPVG